MRNKSVHIVRFLWLIPFFMVFSTVFAVGPELGDGVISGKYFRFYLSMGVIAVMSVWIMIQSPASVRLDRADGLMLLFGMVTMAVSYGVNRSEATTKHVLFVLLVLLYFYFKLLFRSNKQAQYWLFLCFMITGLAESCRGLLQLYGFERSQHHLFRLTGSFFNPGPYACYLAMVLPGALYYVLRNWTCTRVKFRLRYWPVYLRWGIALLTVFGTLLTLPATMSRASWLAALGGCSCMALFYFRRKRQGIVIVFARKKRWIAACCALALCVAGGVGMYRLKKNSADGRALIWKISLQTVAHHPLGVGIGNFSGSYGEQQAAYFASQQGTEQEQRVAGNPEYGFNEYLQICIEQGIVSLLLFLCITGYTLYICIKRRKIAVASSLTALLIAAFMSYPFNVLPFLVALAFLLAAGQWHADDKEKICVYPFNLRCLRAAALTLCGLSVTAYCLCKQYPVYRAYKEWKSTSVYYHSGMYEEAVRAYEKNYPLLHDRIKFLFEYAQSLSKSGQPAKSNEVLKRAMRISCDPMLYNVTGKNHQAMKEYGQAEAAFIRSAQTVPGRLYPFYLLAKLYDETGLHEKASETAEIVLTKEPKVQSQAVKEMRGEMNRLIINKQNE
jgi:tetratricopeptide (TPR) repeat protein